MSAYHNPIEERFECQPRPHKCDLHPFLPNRNGIQWYSQYLSTINLADSLLYDCNWGERKSREGKGEKERETGDQKVSSFLGDSIITSEPLCDPPPSSADRGGAFVVFTSSRS